MTSKITVVLGRPTAAEAPKAVLLAGPPGLVPRDAQISMLRIYSLSPIRDPGLCDLWCIPKLTEGLEKLSA